MDVVEAWAIPPDQFLSVAQVLDDAGLWATGDDMRMQAVAAAASAVHVHEAARPDTEKAWMLQVAHCRPLFEDRACGCERSWKRVTIAVVTEAVHDASRPN